MVHGDTGAVNPARRGTKAAAHYRLMVGAGESVTLRLRLTDTIGPGEQGAEFDDHSFDHIVDERKLEADQFYDSVTPVDLSADARSVMRQSFAGLLWSKQFYHYVVEDWLDGDPGRPTSAGRAARAAAIMNGRTYTMRT